MRVTPVIVAAFVATSAFSQTPGQLRAAGEILQLSGFPETVRAADSAYIRQVLRSSPEWQPYADILAEWTHKVYNWQAWEPLIAKRLAETFTETELDSIARFYRTAPGRKWAAMRAPLQAYFTELFVKTQVELRPVLIDKLRKRAAELQKPIPPLTSHEWGGCLTCA